MYCARIIALWLFNLICDSAVVIVFWVKQCLCFCHSIQDNLCKDNRTRIICHSLCLFCLLKVAVLVLVAMFYGLCMSGCTCTFMLAGFLQLKPLMKTVCFAYVAVGQVSWRYQNLLSKYIPRKWRWQCISQLQRNAIWKF